MERCHVGAYVGLEVVECPEPTCRNFSARRSAELTPPPSVSFKPGAPATVPFALAAKLSFDGDDAARSALAIHRQVSDVVAAAVVADATMRQLNRSIRDASEAFDDFVSSFTMTQGTE